MSNAYPWCYVDFNCLTMEDTLYVPHKKMMGGVPHGRADVFFDREGNSSMAEVIMSGDDSLIARQTCRLGRKAPSDW